MCTLSNYASKFITSSTMSSIIIPDKTPEHYFQERCHIAELLNTADRPGMSIARACIEPDVATVLHLVRGADEVYYILSG